MRNKIDTKIVRLEALKLAMEAIQELQYGCNVWDTERQEYVPPYDTENTYHRDQLRKIEGLKWVYDEIFKLSEKV